MKQLIIALCLVASFAQAQVSQRYAARIYRVGDQLVIADSLGKNQTVYPFSAAQIVATNSLVRVNISGLSKYYTPPKILSSSGVPYSTTSTTAAVAGIIATAPDGTVPSDVSQIGGVKLTDYQADRLITDQAIDAKLTVKTSASFTSAIESKIQYDNSTWARKSGAYTANGGTVLAGPTGYYYEREWSGTLPITYFRNLVSNGDWKPAFDAAQDYLNGTTNEKRGGTIFVNTDIVYVSQLVVQSRITIEGTGRGTCIIRLLNGSNQDVIKIPKSTIFAAIRHITVDGNKSNNTAGNGIFVEGADDTDGHSQNMIWDKSVNGPSSYSYFQMEDVTVTQCAFNGVYIPGTGAGGANYAMYFNNIFTEYNGQNGFFNHSTDNLFSGIYTEKNGNYGINETGSNNKWTNCKTIWNGQLLDKQNGGGVKAAGNRNSFVQIEAQDNYSHAFTDIGIDNFYTNCLADGNGYASQASLLSDRGTYGFYIKNATGTRFSNCRATNYRGLGIQTDGYYVQERGYYIEPQSQNIGTPDIHVSFKHNTPSIPEQNAPVIAQGEIISYRSVTTTVGSTTFAAGEPALTTDGLFVGSNDNIVFPNTVNLGRSGSVVVDFIYGGSSGGTSPRILTSDNAAIDIHFGTVGANNYIYYKLKTGGTTRVCQLALTPQVGQTYRVTMRWKATGDAFRLQGYVSIPDAAGPVSVTNAVASYTLATGETVDPVLNLSINNQTDKLIATYQRLLITSDFVLDAILYQSSRVQEYVKQAQLYTHFGTYKRPTQLWFQGTIPVASVYYRGITLIQRSAGTYADRKLTCVRRFDGTYVWNVENAYTQYYSSKPASGGFDNGNIVWSSVPVSTTTANGSTNVIAGWQSIGGGFANLTPLVIPTSDQFLVGQGVGIPTVTQIPSSLRYLVWRNNTDNTTNIWWNVGAGEIRPITPIGGSVTITGDGTTVNYTIAHGLPYTPTMLTVSGIAYGNLTATSTNITFTTSAVLANGVTSKVYWTAK